MGGMGLLVYNNGVAVTGVTQVATADLGGSVWFLEGNSSLWVTGDASGTREISGQGMTDVVTAESGRTVYAARQRWCALPRQRRDRRNGEGGLQQRSACYRSNAVGDG